MKALTLVLLPLLALPQARAAESPPDAIERPPIVLGVGEQRLLRIPDLERFSLGSPLVAAHAAPREPRMNGGTRPLLLKGVKAGVTDLWVWRASGSPEHRSVHVRTTEPDIRSPELLGALARLQDVEIVYAGPLTVLRGELTSAGEAARVAAVAQGFPKTVKDETELSEALLDEGTRRLEAWVRKSDHPDRLRVERLERTLWLRGSAERPEAADALERRARALFPAVKTDIESLPDAAPTLHFKVYLLEIKKDHFGSFGLSWPDSLEGAFHVTTTGIQSSLAFDLALHSLEGQGSVRVLSQPELSVRAPGEAALFSGGELPIRMQSHFFSDLTWKNFGLTLKLKVAQATPERARLDIFAEVSRLDPSLATADKIPGLQSNQMKTQVDAKIGVPLFLSGLLQESAREQARGLPVLSSIPVLGSLFGSQDYQNQRSELVAVLVPSTQPAQAPMGRLEHIVPRGPVPPPRNWLSPEDERELKDSPAYPWNAVE